ncbi:cell shape determination protein CcmA [Pedobacter sp. JCM 36344]|uniref:cell shape determination protein CcmA n=1 Tax=Pedobacter sp. JCM 36344 TaxID=3374280 RepID=UPI00397C3D28
MKRFNIKSILFFGVAFIIASCTKEVEKPEAKDNPKANALEVSEGPAGTVVSITGSDLGGMKTIMFEKDSVFANFNPVFNNNSAVVFRVPDDASGGNQNIILTNSLNKQIAIPYTVIALPTVTEVSNYNFETNTEITLTGNNLNDVVSVGVTGTSATATIVSQKKRSLVIKMPSTDVNSAALTITNSTGPIVTNQVFVNLDKAYKIFTEGYNNGFENASWGPASTSTAFAKTGATSFKAGYIKGNWSANGFANWTGIANTPGFKFMSFWVKGASAAYTLYVTGDQREGGYGNSDTTVPIQIPANVWTYFKIPMETLQLWKKGGPFKQIGFFIQGPDAQDEAFYFDDVIFIR